MVKVECKDYGYECEFSIEEKGKSMIEKLKEHFDQAHGIDYSTEAIIQMLVNKGYSRSSLTQD